MFIFSFLVQKKNFRKCQFWRMGAAINEFCLFKLSSYPVLGECCFKGPKVLLDEYFNIEMLIIFVERTFGLLKQFSPNIRCEDNFKR